MPSNGDETLVLVVAEGDERSRRRQDQPHLSSEATTRARQDVKTAGSPISTRYLVALPLDPASLATWEIPLLLLYMARLVQGRNVGTACTAATNPHQHPNANDLLPPPAFPTGSLAWRFAFRDVRARPLDSDLSAQALGPGTAVYRNHPDLLGHGYVVFYIVATAPAILPFYHTQLVYAHPIVGAGCVGRSNPLFASDRERMAPSGGGCFGHLISIITFAPVQIDFAA